MSENLVSQDKVNAALEILKEGTGLGTFDIGPGIAWIGVSIMGAWAVWLAIKLYGATSDGKIPLNKALFSFLLAFLIWIFTSIIIT